MKKEIIDKYYKIVDELTQDVVTTKMAYGNVGLPNIIMILYAALHKGHQLTELDLKQILVYVMEGEVCKHNQ